MYQHIIILIGLVTIYQMVDEQHRSRGVKGDVRYFTPNGSHRPSETKHSWFVAGAGHRGSRPVQYAPNDNLISIEIDANHFFPNYWIKSSG